MTPYPTPQQRRRQAAAAHQIRTDAVELMDDIAAVWRDPAARPPGAAAAHDHAADMLGGPREESP